MSIAGMKTECGNYIIDSIVDVGPTFLDSDIKKELTESDLYIPMNIYNEMESTKMQLNGTVQNSCGVLEIKKEIKKEVKSETSSVDLESMMMETRLKTRSRSSTIESGEAAVRVVSRNTLRSGRTRNGNFRFDDSVERPYMCSGCNKTYLTSQNLTQHKKRSCSGRKGYTCHQCNRCFFTVSSLTLHSKVHWDPQIQSESAEASCVGLKKTGLIQVKKLSDNKEEKYMCDICGKMFVIKYALTLHKMIHMSATKNAVDTNTNSQNGTADRKGDHLILMSNEFETNRLVMDEGNGKLLMTNGLEQKSPVANGLENTSLRRTGLSPVEKQTVKSSILNAADEVDDSETSGSFSCSLCDLSLSKTAFDNHQMTHKHSKIRQLLQEPSTDIERDEKGTFYYTLLADKTRMTKMYTSVSDPNAVAEATANGDRFDEKCVYICQLCKMGFHVYSIYLKHMQKHAQEHLFLCGVCGKGFQTVGTLSVHMKIHTDDYQAFKCTICDLELPTLSKLTHHKATTHMHRVYECDICGKGFFRSWHLKEHRANHKDNEVKECDVCGTSFPEIGSLRKHMWSHLKEARMGVKGPVSTSLGVRNLQERAGEQSYPCDECYKVYHSRNRLVLHKRTHSREKLSKCDLCDKEFFSPSELNRHQRTHTGEKPFQCGECGKSFALATTLKDHIRSHTGEKPFKCFMCNKSYSSSSILGRHKLTHIGKRKFKCDLCNKSFLYNASLQVHQRTHSGEKPYTCEVCNKSFTMLCHYRVHTRIHTGERPYQCPYCDKDFNNYGSHYKHIRKHPEFKDNLAVDNIDALSNVISMMESDQLETELIEEIS